MFMAVYVLITITSLLLRLLIYKFLPTSEVDLGATTSKTERLVINSEFKREAVLDDCDVYDQGSIFNEIFRDIKKTFFRYGNILCSDRNLPWMNF